MDPDFVKAVVTVLAGGVVGWLLISRRPSDPAPMILGCLGCLSLSCVLSPNIRVANVWEWSFIWVLFAVAGYSIFGTAVGILRGDRRWHTIILWGVLALFGSASLMMGVESIRDARRTALCGGSCW